MPPRVRCCLICHRPLAEAEDRWFPFCSERCKWVDLGRWLGEAYRIPGPEAAEALPTGGKEGGEEEPARQRGNGEGEPAVEEAGG